MSVQVFYLLVWSDESGPVHLGRAHNIRMSAIFRPITCSSLCRKSGDVSWKCYPEDADQQRDRPFRHNIRKLQPLQFDLHSRRIRVHQHLRPAAGAAVPAGKVRGGAGGDARRLHPAGLPRQGHGHLLPEERDPHQAAAVRPHGDVQPERGILHQLEGPAPGPHQPEGVPLPPVPEAPRRLVPEPRQERLEPGQRVGAAPPPRSAPRLALRARRGPGALADRGGRGAGTC